MCMWIWAQIVTAISNSIHTTYTSFKTSRPAPVHPTNVQFRPHTWTDWQVLFPQTVDVVHNITVMYADKRTFGGGTARWGVGRVLAWKFWTRYSDVIHNVTVARLLTFYSILITWTTVFITHQPLSRENLRTMPPTFHLLPTVEGYWDIRSGSPEE